MLNGLAAALGVAALIIASPALFEALRWGGVAFLLYLAWDAWRTPTMGEGCETQGPSSFMRGLITNLLNPKAAMFYVAVLPRFMSPGTATLAQSLTLTALHVLVATVVHAGIVLFAAQSRRLFAVPAFEQRVRRALALLLAAVALWLLWDTAK
jgi:threonine/homoserine/homoserine lactone efflux protein